MLIEMEAVAVLNDLNSKLSKNSHYSRCHIITSELKLLPVNAADSLPIDYGSLLIDESYKPLFPSTRYYGSKRRHLDWLRGELKHLKGRTVLDAFGGTGAVSYLLSDLGWETTYNDIFDFNVISAQALFSTSSNYLTREALQSFLTKVQPIKGFITNTFEGLYFTNEENMWLDGFMACLNDQPPEDKNLLLYLLFQACLKKRPFNLFHRANLNLRYSDMPVKFGNRSTWLKSFSNHMLATYQEVERVRHKLSSATVNVINSQSAETIPPKFDLIYLDPPYFKKSKKTETYLERYHFLEGLARYNEWENLIDLNSPLRAIKPPYKQEWVRKNEMITNIESMIKTHHGSMFALSYVAGETPTEEELLTLFRKYFREVRISRRSHKRVLSSKESQEILLIGQ